MRMLMYIIEKNNYECIADTSYEFKMYVFSEAWKTHIPNGFQMYDVANILGEPMTENSDPIVIDDSD